MFSKQTRTAGANRNESFAAQDEPSLDRRGDDLAAKRTELTTKLGALIYEQTKTDPQARRGREVLYDGIAEVDRELENLKREREHLAQLATPAGHAFCPFCGKQVSAAAIFCPQCGTRLTASDLPHRAASLTDQLEELDLEEPDFDETPLAETAATDARSDGSANGAGNAATTNAATANAVSGGRAQAVPGEDSQTEHAPNTEIAAQPADVQLAPTAGTSGMPAITGDAGTTVTGNGTTGAAETSQADAGATADDSRDNADQSADADEDNAASAADETAAISGDATAAVPDAGANATSPNSTGAAVAESAPVAGGVAAQADPASVLCSSRRDGIADALAPAADSVSAFHLAPEIIREAQADLTPEDEFTPAAFPDDDANADATKLLPVVTVEDAAHDNTAFDPDSYGFDDSFSLDDEFDLKMAARERKNDDPDATQILPTAVVEASSFENDATEVLPGTVDDAPDFDESDATRIMTAIPDDGDHYEPDPLQRTYRSF